MSEIPPRLRQDYCQRFVVAFELALIQAPKPMTVLGFDLAGATLAARLRDAHLSMRRYSWGPEDVRHADCVIRLTPGGVTITAEPSTAHQAKSAKPAVLGSTLNLTTDQLEAFCTLLSHSFIVGPVYILNDFDPLYIRTLEERFNVAIEHEPSNNRFVLL